MNENHNLLSESNLSTGIHIRNCRQSGILQTENNSEHVTYTLTNMFPNVGMQGTIEDATMEHPD